MNSQNLVFSLHKRELSGILKFKKPLKSYSLSSLIGIDRFSDIFLGFSIGCDFIISLSFDNLDNDDLYANSLQNVTINFNTSPIIGDQVKIFHQIKLGSFPNFSMNFHFYQNPTNPDSFVASISEPDTSFLSIIYGNMPQKTCGDCQSKRCRKHGLITRFAYQSATSDGQNRITAIYPYGESLVVVLADCESNIRLITVNFAASLSTPYSYPSSRFPLAIYRNGFTIIENECNCFYDDGTVLESELCVEAKFPSTVPSEAVVACCHKCANDKQLLGCESLGGHIEMSQDGGSVHSHSIRGGECVRSVLLPGRAARVETCAPCSKRVFLNDVGSSYRSSVLWRRKIDEEERFEREAYDDGVHCEVIGDGECYCWGPTESDGAVIVSEELVISTGSWAGGDGREESVHCLGLSTGKLECCLKLLVHLMDAADSGRSRLMELDLSTGVAVPVPLTHSTAGHVCQTVARASRGDRALVADLNNDLQVSDGRSLDSLTDHSGLFELRH